MARFTVIDGTPAPDTPVERVRARIRKQKIPQMPQCPRCAGREYVTARIGRTQSKLCVICLMRGERVVMD